MARKQLCMNWMLAKKADVDRIYLPCQEGRRSLMNLEKEYKATMVGLHKYMMNEKITETVNIVYIHCQDVINMISCLFNYITFLHHKQK